MDAQAQYLLPKDTRWSHKGRSTERKTQSWPIQQGLLLVSGFLNIWLFLNFVVDDGLQECIRKTNAYCKPDHSRDRKEKSTSGAISVSLTARKAPLYDRIQISMSEGMTTNRTLPMEPGVHSKYRGDPSPELDAAWEHLTTTHMFPVTEEEVLRLGKDPEYVTRMPEEFGFGSGLYAGFMDVFHNIHCLDYLRRQAYPDYYGQPLESPLGTLHRDHCIEILLEELMCRPNMEIILYRYVSRLTRPAKRPDMVMLTKI